MPATLLEGGAVGEKVQSGLEAVRPPVEAQPEPPTVPAAQPAGETLAGAEFAQGGDGAQTLQQGQSPKASEKPTEPASPVVASPAAGGSRTPGASPTAAEGPRTPAGSPQEQQHGGPSLQSPTAVGEDEREPPWSAKTLRSPPAAGAGVAAKDGTAEGAVEAFQLSRVSSNVPALPAKELTDAQQSIDQASPTGSDRVEPPFTCDESPAERAAVEGGYSPLSLTLAASPALAGSPGEAAKAAEAAEAAAAAAEEAEAAAVAPAPVRRTKDTLCC